MMKRLAVVTTAAIAVGLLTIAWKRPSAVAFKPEVLTAFPLFQSQEVWELQWQDLVPAKDFEDPYDILSQRQFGDLANIALLRELQADNRTPTETSIRLAAEGLQRLTAEGIDIDGLLARRDEISLKYDAWSRSIQSELDDQTVSLGGYMLPLEYSGTKVTEFLLVPYLGACIHTPPPPPNQIVHVKSTRGIKTKGLYDPVLVTGVLSSEASSPHLSYVDGTANIDVSYGLNARQVKPWQP